MIKQTTFTINIAHSESWIQGHGI